MKEVRNIIVYLQGKCKDFASWGKVICGQWLLSEALPRLELRLDCDGFTAAVLWIPAFIWLDLGNGG